jgi:hypothetical protein
MLKLDKVLVNKKVQENIKSNFNLSKDELEYALVATITNVKDNAISVAITKDGSKYDFENTLHYDVDKQIYLLESRMFGTDGSMYNSYLEILDKDGNIADIPYVDDVWDYADWKLVC